MRISDWSSDVCASDLPTPEQADVLARSVARTFAQHMAEERTSLYTSAAAFSLEVSEAERLAVRQAYRQKYGVEPTDASGIQSMARVAQQQRGGGDECPAVQLRPDRRRHAGGPPTPRPRGLCRRPGALAACDAPP